MWKLCQKAIFARWAVRRQGYTKHTESKSENLDVSLLSTSEDNGNSNGDNFKRQQARRRNRFWDDPQYQYYAIQSPFLETIGWLGTAFAVGVNTKHHIVKQQQFDNEFRLQHHVDQRQIYTSLANLFSKFVWAMPKSIITKYALPERTILPKPDRKDSTGVSSDKVAPSIDKTLNELQQAAVSYIAESENMTGLALIDKNSDQSFHFFKLSAERGCTKALFNLGLCYEIGKGTTIDLKKAVECYTKASNQGHSYATYNLGVFHLQELDGIPQNQEVGLNLMKKAADLGVSQAQVYLGLQYLEEEKSCDAFTMFNSAQQNNVEGAYYLGMCYENGWGVAQDEKMAAEMYAQAAAKGHQDALFNLGLYNEQGRGGLIKNERFAVSLYQIIADMGHSDARKALHALQTRKNSLKYSNFSQQSSNLSHKTISSSANGSNLHGSASSPELSNCNTPIFSFTELNNYELPQLPKATNSVSSQYLDLMIPAVPLSQMCKYDKSLHITNSKEELSAVPMTNVIRWDIPHVIATGV